MNVIVYICPVQHLYCISTMVMLYTYSVTIQGWLQGYFCECQSTGECKWICIKHDCQYFFLSWYRVETEKLCYVVIHWMYVKSQIYIKTCRILFLIEIWIGQSILFLIKVWIGLHSFVTTFSLVRDFESCMKNHWKFKLRIDQWNLPTHVGIVVSHTVWFYDDSIFCSSPTTGVDCWMSCKHVDNFELSWSSIIGFSILYCL